MNHAPGRPLLRSLGLLMAFAAGPIVSAPGVSAQQCFDGNPRDAIASIREAYMRAFNAGRIDDVVDLHAVNVVFMPAGLPPMEGRAPLRELTAQSFQHAPDGFTFEFEARDLRVADGWAVERGVTRAHLSGAGEDVPGGKYVLLYEPDAEGCWRIAWSITNTDARPPARQQPPPDTSREAVGTARDGDRLRLTRLDAGAPGAPGAPGADSLSSPSASWTDLDGDGDEDLYVLNGYGSLEPEPVPQQNQLYRNDGGRFTLLPDHALSRPIAFAGSGVWGDYDNDGDRDLFVANQRGADNHLFRWDAGADGRFARVTGGAAVSDGGRSFSASWIDIDGDGLLDLHVYNGRDGGGGERDFVYRNAGAGRLVRVETPFTADALPSGGGAWADYDRDGDPDLFLPVNSTEPNRLYVNHGGWRFTEAADSVGLDHAPLPGSPTTSVGLWADYDNDLDLDLFVGNSRGTADFMYENDGAGRLRRVRAGRIGLDATYVSDALFADLDNDADLDLVIAVWGGASEVYLNDGAGGLYPADADELGAVISFASSVSASDIDADGDLDLYFTHWPINRSGGEPNRLYRNDTAAGHWLVIELEGRASNRSAIGAIIELTATIGGETVRQLRHVASRTSWRSAGGLSRHFGLGDASTVDRVVVYWPSGAIDTVAGPIEANRTLKIVESSSPGGGAR